MIGDVNVRATHGKYVHRAHEYGPVGEPFTHPIRLLCNTSPAWHFAPEDITSDPVDCPHCLKRINRARLVTGV